jgi:hypothetical protein
MAPIGHVSRLKARIQPLIPFRKKGRIEKIKGHDMVRHETKRKALTKFLLVLAIVVLYWVFISLRYGKVMGAQITLLTWSLFILCTPIASAGLLVDFPVRLITRLRMFHTEIAVWAFALALNGFTLAANASVYDTTILLSVLKFILTNPVPYWSVIFVSAAGTFVSIRFADELLDVSREKHRKYYLTHQGKHTLIIFSFIILVLALFYGFIVQAIGLELPVF